MNKLLVILLLLFNVTLVYAQSADGEYVSIKGLEKSLGVNMKFIPPQGWNETVPRRPHIVKNYVNPVDGSGMNILVVELPTFVSRNEFKESMEEFYSEMCDELKKDKRYDSFTVLSHKCITLDQYPFLMLNALVESHNRTFRYIYTTLMTAYEDVCIHICFYIQSEMTDYRIPRKVIDSVVFPDQYLTY